MSIFHRERSYICNVALFEKGYTAGPLDIGIRKFLIRGIFFEPFLLFVIGKNYNSKIVEKLDGLPLRNIFFEKQNLLVIRAK